MLVCAFIALTVSAQKSDSFFSSETSNEPITFGIRGGVNFSNISSPKGTSYESHTGFNAGVTVDIPLLQSLYLQSGLYYTVKGTEITEKDGGDVYKIKANPSYLEIPILASYRYNFSDAAQLQINFGPYFAYGIGGKLGNSDFFGDKKLFEEENDYFDDESYKYQYRSSSSTRSYNYYDDEDDEYPYDDEEGSTGAGAKRFDVGLQFGAGITLARHYYLGVAYEFGFVNMFKNNGSSSKNSNFMINIGYQF